MGIAIKAVPTEDFEEWCDRLGLTIEVVERGADDAAYTGKRYYGNLSRGKHDAEIAEDGMLSSPCSSGNTVREVVAQMARDYSEKRIAFGAYSKERENIFCPRFTVKP